MKIKTSITLSQELDNKIDQLSCFYGNRSALIEKAVRDLIKAEEKRHNDLKDLEILNQNAEILNDEADDVLSSQKFFGEFRWHPQSSPDGGPGSGIGYSCRD
jgi:metal-responsive CopG/Arc/MetJ family transcriptional regulator